MTAAEYHDYLLADKGETPLEACIGDEETDQITQDWLEQALFKLEFNFKTIGGRVIEVMSGMGRHYHLLKKKFMNIEMLDASKEMMKANVHPVIKHECYIEHFDWRRGFYDCIVGSSSLCYLDGEVLKNVLSKMDQSLAQYGFMVFLEPIDESLGDLEQQDFIYKEQRMKIRSTRFYERKFKELSLKRAKTIFYRRRADLVHDMAVFVIKEQAF